MRGESRWSLATKRWVVLGLVLVVALVVWRAGNVLPPFIWAGIFAYVFTPVVGFAQRRTRLPRPAIVLALFLVLGVAVYLVGSVVLPAAIRELRELPRTLPQLLRNAETLLTTMVSGTGYEQYVAVAFDQITEIAGGITGRLVPFAFGLFVAVIETLAFVVSLWFLLVDGPRLTRLLRDQLPRAHREEVLQMIERINGVLGQYVRGQVTLVFLMWTVTFIGLSMLRVPFALPLGFMTGVLETIPIIGPITAGAVAVLVALGVENAPFGWSQVGYALVVAIMYTVLRHMEDYLVIPTLIGRIVELHPLVVIFSLLVGGAVGGLLGILLAVPIAASIRIAGAYVLAKLRDEDPYPAVAEALAEPGKRVAAVKERPA